jgi:hypothetical protein
MRSEDRRVTRSPQTGASNARLRLEQPCTLVAVGVDPELAHHRLVLIDGGGGKGILVRVDPVMRGWVAVPLSSHAGGRT